MIFALIVPEIASQRASTLDYLSLSRIYSVFSSLQSRFPPSVVPFQFLSIFKRQPMVPQPCPPTPATNQHTPRVCNAVTSNTTQSQPLHFTTQKHIISTNQCAEAGWIKQDVRSGPKTRNRTQRTAGETRANQGPGRRVYMRRNLP